MRVYRVLLAIGAAVAAVVTAFVVYAALNDTQTASGTLNATSTSADLYICEPSGGPGPACGPDDSGADETVFEGIEDIRPGENRTWDLRLVNVGTVDLFMTKVGLVVVESSDPGLDCPSGTLQPGQNSSGEISTAGVFALGKAGDEANDNPLRADGMDAITPESSAEPKRNIKIAAGDYEDVRLRLRLRGDVSQDCDANEWKATWTFEAS